jgi:hypothetical protein
MSNPRRHFPEEKESLRKGTDILYTANYVIPVWDGFLGL